MLAQKSRKSSASGGAGTGASAGAAQPRPAAAAAATNQQVETQLQARPQELVIVQQPAQSVGRAEEWPQGKTCLQDNCSCFCCQCPVWIFVVLGVLIVLLMGMFMVVGMFVKQEADKMNTTTLAPRTIDFTTSPPALSTTPSY